MSEATATVVVLAPIFTVVDYLADVGRLPEYLVGARTVARAGEAVTVRYREARDGHSRIAPARFRFSRPDRRLDWEITTSARYAGRIEIYGDCSISQLHSTLRSSSARICSLLQTTHRQTLRRIAQAIESMSQRTPTHADVPPALPGSVQTA